MNNGTINNLIEWSEDVEYAFWLVILFALLYEPIVGYFDFQKLKIERKNKRKKLKTKYYINSIIGLWVPTIFILLLVIFSDLTLVDIGYHGQLLILNHSVQLLPILCLV